MKLLIFLLASSIGIAAQLYPEHALHHWRNAAFLVAEEFTVPIDPAVPYMKCSEALTLARSASALSRQIEKESSELSQLIRFLANADPRVIRSYLPQVRLRQQRVVQLRGQLQEKLPASLQQKDRTRTLTWKLNPKQFSLPCGGIHTGITWGQLEVLRGGTYAPFQSDNPVTRPMRKRLKDLLLNVLPDLEEQYFSMLDGILTETLTDVFHDETKGSKEQIDWQGKGPIRLVETLSPSEACIENYHLFGAMLIDYSRVLPGSGTTPPIFKQVDGFATGPVILHYGVR